MNLKKYFAAFPITVIFIIIVCFIANGYMAKNPCWKNPCLNNGTCYTDIKQNATCVCHDNFEGEKCEQIKGSLE